MTAKCGLDLAVNGAALGFPTARQGHEGRSLFAAAAIAATIRRRRHRAGQEGNSNLRREEAASG